MPWRRLHRKKHLLDHAQNAVLPLPSNNHHPYVLKQEIILVVLVFVVVIEMGAIAQNVFPFGNTNYFASVLPPVVADLASTQSTSNNSQSSTPDDAAIKTAVKEKLIPASTELITAIAANSPTKSQVSETQTHASPFTVTNAIFTFIAAFLIAVFVAGLMYRRRLPRMTATISGVALVLLVLGFVILNQLLVSN